MTSTEDKPTAKTLKLSNKFNHLFLSAQKLLVKYPDERLRMSVNWDKKLSDVTHSVESQMREMLNKTSGVGLAANQMGFNEPLILVSVDNEMVSMFAPKIIRQSEETQVVQEGCLSIPGLYGDVERAKSVTVAYTDLSGESNEETFTGYSAAIIQHEIDHLNGVLFFDRANSDSLIWASNVLKLREKARIIN